jgi:subtilase family serine protease
MSWTRLEIVDTSGYQYYWYTWDGWVDGYLDPGTYQATITEWNHNEGHRQVAFTLNVNQGEQNNALNFILLESQIAIPELTSVPLMVVGAIAAALLVAGRRRRR